MKRRSTVLLAAVSLSLLGAVGGGSWFLNNVVGPKGAGYHAKILCSAVFVAKRDPGQVLATDLGRFWYVQGQVDATKSEATSSVFGFGTTTAVYRGGSGCTLARGATAEQLRATPLPVPPPRQTRDLPWPTGDQGATVELTSDQNLRLQAALDVAFAEPNEGPRPGTRAVVVVHGGRIVAERYAPGFSSETPLVGWSMTKSVTATLVGLAQGQGRLDTRQPVKIPGWEADRRSAITWDHLLRMSSGLTFDETYGALGDATQMLFVEPSAALYAARSPAGHAPDEVWSYSSGTTNLLQLALRDALGADYARFPRQALFDPIGMQSAVIEPDASGVFVGSSFMLATARDWARFGLLHQQDGMWEGKRILPEGWVRYVTNPAPGAPMRQYGAQWWLNAGDPADPQKRRWPTVPTDAFDASGFEGQNVLVVPSRQVVIVRLGLSPDGGWDFGRFAGSILEALPAEAPSSPADPKPHDPVEDGPVDRSASVHRGEAPYLPGQASITLDDLKLIQRPDVTFVAERLTWTGHPNGPVTLTLDGGVLLVERPDPTTVRFLLTLAELLDAHASTEAGARLVSDPTSPRGFREVRPQGP